MGEIKLPEKISFITGSPEKFREAHYLLPFLSHVDLDLPEIQELDQKKIISAKLEATRSRKLNRVLVEDTGLYFASLDFSLPGPLIKWFLKGLGLDGLVKLCELRGSSQAFALTTVGYLDSYNSTPLFFEGRAEGVISKQRGSGFGWDSIFQPEGHTRTFAEMTLDEKSKISHRGKAFNAFLKHLNDNHFSL